MLSAVADCKLTTCGVTLLTMEYFGCSFPMRSNDNFNFPLG